MHWHLPRVAKGCPAPAADACRGRRSARRDACRCLAFFAPEIEVFRLSRLGLPALRPRVAGAEVMARRLAALTRLGEKRAGPAILLTTVNAVLQRVWSRETLEATTFAVVPGPAHQYGRSAVVPDAEWLFAHRHGGRSWRFRGARRHHRPLPAWRCEPVRLDFFGDTLETIRSFDPQSQRYDRHAHGNCRSIRQAK